MSLQKFDQTMVYKEDMVKGPMNWITPAPQPGKYHTVPPPGSRIAVDGPPPGYTGFVPAYKNHLVGHSYGDSCRRAAAITDSFRIGKPELAIHLVNPTGNWNSKNDRSPQQKNFLPDFLSFSFLWSEFFCFSFFLSCS